MTLYCFINEGEKKKTQFKKQDENPIWNEKFIFSLGTSCLNYGDMLEVRLIDHGYLHANRQIGKGSVVLSSLLDKKSILSEVELFDMENDMLELVLSLNF